ncbi:MAG: glycosyltransferase [Anaerolineae bacterium]|nr:glycosyltransferase [Anaerolineae bacterium]
MAHILFIYKQLPAPAVGHAGGESLYWLMEGLHNRGHELSLVARIRKDEVQHLATVEGICRNVKTVPHHTTMGGSKLVNFPHSYWLLRQAAAWALGHWQPDLVHVETTQTAAAIVGLSRPPASFRTQDINWFMMEQVAAGQRSWRKWLTGLKRRFFLKLEPWLARQYDIILAISEGDRRRLAPYCPQHSIGLLPLSPLVKPTDGQENTVPQGINVLFVGAMSREHNINGVIWFLDKVWPRILNAVPAAKFYIVGKSPPPQIECYHNKENVFVTGFVDDLTPWYRAATVFVSPLLVGGGLLQKVMDALAMGTPVVATPASNHGLGAQPGEQLLIAGEPETFGAAVIRLLQDGVARTRLGQAGQVFVNTHYDIEAAIDRWEESLLQFTS